MPGPSMTHAWTLYDSCLDPSVTHAHTDMTHDPSMRPLSYPLKKCDAMWATCEKV